MRTHQHFSKYNSSKVPIFSCCSCLSNCCTYLGVTALSFCLLICSEGSLLVFIWLTDTQLKQFAIGARTLTGMLKLIRLHVSQAGRTWLAQLAKRCLESLFGRPREYSWPAQRYENFLVSTHSETYASAVSSCSESRDAVQCLSQTPA